MPELDIATVLILHTTSLLVCALAFAHLRRQSAGTRGLRCLAGAFLALALGALMAGLGERALLPARLWMPGSLAIGTGGYGLLWLGLRHLSGGRGVRRPWLMLAVPLGWVGLDIVTGFAADNPLRASAFHLTAGLLLLAAAREVAHDRRVEPLPSRTPLALLLAGAAAIYGGELALILAGRVHVPSIALGFALQIVANFGIGLLVYGLVKERAESGLRLAAEIDSLTGIGNRRWLNARLPGVIRRGDTLMMLDVDHFKSINDRHGHAAGDHVLTVFAAAISRNLRAQDAFARTGGEEFVIYMPELDRQDALAAAERLCRLVEALPIQHRGTGIPVTVSLGVACSDGEYRGWDQMLHAADSALYRAKGSGRNRAVLQPMAMQGEPVA